jgi:glycoside/pentoside/hexuronide:cation symporter, GPH family
MSDLDGTSTASNKQRWLYGLANLGLQIPGQMFGAHVLFFYTDTMRLPAAWTAAVMTLYAIYNAVNNPFLGYLQDRSTSPNGRRIPPLKFGTLPWVIMFALFWMPPFNGVQQPVLLLIWFVVTLVIYDALGTTVSTAYYSLLPEMFPDYKERTDVAARMNIFLTIALLVGVAAPPILGQLLGWGVVGVLFACISGIAIYIGLRGMRERKDVRPTTTSFLNAFKTLISNFSFMTLTAAQTMRFVTTNAMLAGMQFFIKYTLKLDPGQTAIVLVTVFVVSGVMQYPWRQLIANRFEARTTAMLGYAVVAVSVATLWFANSLLSTIISAAFIGVGFAGIFLMDNILISDVIDEDETRTGERREGMYFGVNTLLTTLSTAISSVAFGIISSAYGYDTALSDAAQPASAATGFRVFMTALPVLGCILALIMLRFYPLHGQRLRQIKTALAVK